MRDAWRASLRPRGAGWPPRGASGMPRRHMGSLREGLGATGCIRGWEGGGSNTGGISIFAPTGRQSVQGCSMGVLWTVRVGAVPAKFCSHGLFPPSQGHPPLCFPPSNSLVPDSLEEMGVSHLWRRSRCFRCAWPLVRLQWSSDQLSVEQTAAPLADDLLTIFQCAFNV